jgi:hypothetical protein
MAQLLQFSVEIQPVRWRSPSLALQGSDATLHAGILHRDSHKAPERATHGLGR